MPELERRLTRLGEEVDWPRTPDLTVSVMVRLDEPARRQRLAGLLPPAGLRRSLALAVVALLVLAGTVFAAAPGVRDAVLDFFGLQGATVERRETLPAPPPQRPLDLGTRTTLESAAARLGFAAQVPAALGKPDAVYVRRGLPGGELSLAYRPRAGLPRARSTRLGLLLSEFRGDLSPSFLGKVVGQATSAERLSIGADRAIWIEGAPHYFFYRAPDGSFVDTDMRIAQNVLLLERGPLLLRFEGAFDRGRAIELARSLP
ncbi:MAG: hypothetical protein QOD71_3085 [Thermoleophilaceae bacterium]|jgi:hypothetical protein|nr:hypothetical protein [Thermoleophilaceae bacterium]